MTPGKGVISGWESRRRLKGSLLLLRGCVPSTTPLPLAFPHREFTKFSESTKTLTKAEAEEPEGPWAPQPGKNAARQSETKAWGRWGEGEKAGCHMGQHYLKCSVLFRSEPIRSADTTEYFTIVGTSTKRSLRNGLIQDLLSSTSPPTVVETHGDFNRRFSNRNSKKQPTFKTVWLTHYFLQFGLFLFFNTLHQSFSMGFVGGKVIPIMKNRPLKEAFVVFFTSKNYRGKVKGKQSKIFWQNTKKFPPKKTFRGFV